MFPGEEGLAEVVGGVCGAREGEVGVLAREGDLVLEGGLCGHEEGRLRRGVVERELRRGAEWRGVRGQGGRCEREGQGRGAGD